jgi:hypothetical protein
MQNALGRLEHRKAGQDGPLRTRDDIADAQAAPFGYWHHVSANSDRRRKTAPTLKTNANWGGRLVIKAYPQRLTGQVLPFGIGAWVKCARAALICIYVYHGGFARFVYPVLARCIDVDALALLRQRDEPWRLRAGGGRHIHAYKQRYKAIKNLTAISKK